MSGGNVLENLPPAARGSFYKNRPWTPQKFFISAGSFHLKKPSRWPKALIGPPCHGAPWTREASAKAFD
jgi:hypothetical protein